MEIIEKTKIIADKLKLNTFTMYEEPHTKLFISRLDENFVFGSPHFVPKLFDPYNNLVDAFNLLEFSEYIINKTGDWVYSLKVHFYDSQKWIVSTGSGPQGLQEAICEAFLLKE